MQFNDGAWGHRSLLGRILDSLRTGKHREPRERWVRFPSWGKWVRLSIPAQKIGLRAKDQVNGIAFTQWDGTTCWDQIGVSLKIDPRKDPYLSLRAWTTQAKSDESLPAKVQNALKKRPRIDRWRTPTFENALFAIPVSRNPPMTLSRFKERIQSTKTNSRKRKPRSKRPTKISKITVRSLEVCWSPKAEIPVRCESFLVGTGWMRREKR